jgi:hypothetical protein
MPDEKSMGHDLNIMEEHGDDLELVGENPAHAPRPGMKTPQVKEFDEDAIDESGNLLHPKEKDENDGM